MEETLGKRIVANRKRLGITQDRLAEQLGVTAQAVSKWENDQSCPDIAMLPKLAEIFGISVDALLGIAPQQSEAAVEAEVVTSEASSEAASGHGANWEFHWDSGRKGYLGLATWIILTGGWMFAAAYYHIDADFWDLLWTNGLIIFGLLGLFPRFSFFRLGCTLFGIHSLLKELDTLPGYLDRDLLLPAFLLLLGLSLLVKAMRKPRGARFCVTHNGKSVVNAVGSCDIHGDSFNCECVFSSKTHIINLPTLRYGNADVSFGQMMLDLTQVESFAPDCRIDTDCAFGSLTVLVPTNCHAEVNADSAFGSVDIRGSHDSETTASIYIDADASFGHIVVQYV